MTEQEVSVRLTENDERLYACAKRLEAVERFLNTEQETGSGKGP